MLTAGRVRWQCLFLLFAARASAFESQWISGLDVSTERLTGQIGFNGVLFRVQRATGPDVHLLAERMLRHWRRESGRDGVIPLTGTGWNMYSRIHHGESEVVQWRDAGDRSELLWSMTDLRVYGNAPPEGSVPLPPECRWLAPAHGNVQGNPFIQTTGSCAGEAKSVSTAFMRLLSSRGWAAHQWSSGMLQLERGKRRAQIVLMPAPDRDPSARTYAVVLELGDRSSTP